VNDARSSEEHMLRHIQFLNKMQMWISTIDTNGHDNSKIME
jgi:hypothetical protein